MSRHPWSADHELDAATVEKIVAARFPALRPVRASFLGEGWVFFAFTVNEDLCFRFPKRRDGEDTFERERLVVQTIRNRLTLPVPLNRWMGEPDEDFPYRFAGQERIRGECALAVRPPRSKWPRLAREMGRFLSGLHSFPPDRAIELGLPAWSPRSHVDAAGMLHREIDEARGVLPDELLDRCREFGERELPRYVPHRGEPVFCHNDLLPGHIFLDAVSFDPTGVIDWEDAGLGDPAGDLVGLSMWLGSGFVHETLGYYDRPVEDGFLRRVRWWTVWVSILEAKYAILTGDDHLRSTALRSLEIHASP